MQKGILYRKAVVLNEHGFEWNRESRTFERRESGRVCSLPVEAIEYLKSAGDLATVLAWATGQLRRSVQKKGRKT